MAKIYVSSTFLDLEAYRAQVEKVIRRMGHIDVAMEYYVAEDHRPVASARLVLRLGFVHVLGVSAAQDDGARREG